MKTHMFRIRYGLLFILFLLISIPCGAKITPLPDLMKPASMAVDESQLYVSDGTRVHIYSLKDFSRKYSFGKKGEGPQEFLIRGSFGVEVLPREDHLFINSQGKASYFTKQGKFLKELKTGTPSPFTPLGDQFIGYSEIQEGKDTIHTLNLYDSKFKKLKEIKRWLHPIQESKMEILLVPLYTKAHTYKKHVFAAPGSDFIIDVHNNKGEKIRSIKHPYEKMEVTQTYKTTTLEFFKTDPRWRKNFQIIKTMGRFPKYYHAIRFFVVADDHIYVQTYGKKEEKSEFFIFDIKGKFIKKLYVPFKDDMGINIVPRHTVKGGKLYQLIFNDDSEQWEMHIHQLH